MTATVLRFPANAVRRRQPGATVTDLPMIGDRVRLDSGVTGHLVDRDRDRRFVVDVQGRRIVARTVTVVDRSRRLETAPCP